MIVSDSFFKNSSSPFPLSANGDKVKVNLTNSLHYGDVKQAESNDNVSESFAAAMNKALEKVNDQQIEADKLTQQLVFNPESVDAHEVMIAGEKARISLTFTKTVADAVVRAYRELTNLK